MLDLPVSITLLFCITTLIAFVFVVVAMFQSSHEGTRKRANILSLFLLMWLVFQSTLALNQWYMNRKSVPPHLMFPLVVSAVVIVLLFFTPRGRKFVDGLSTETLTWLHIVRIPVEITLFMLATYKQIPLSMTFEGHNFDILSGLTAPIIAWWGIRKKRIPATIVMLWNIAALLLVLIVMITGIGALPSPMQQWDFSQPNYAVMLFPFVWLPSFIVPLMIFSHIAVLRGFWKTRAR